MHLAVCVEGQTEEEFIKVVLAARLHPLGIAPDPILIGGGREREAAGALPSSNSPRIWRVFITLTTP